MIETPSVKDLVEERKSKYPADANYLLDSTGKKKMNARRRKEGWCTCALPRKKEAYEPLKAIALDGREIWRRKTITGPRAIFHQIHNSITWIPMDCITSGSYLMTQ